MMAGEGLHPSSKGARVLFAGDRRTVIDGPFAETKELIAGFWIWKVKTLEEAIEWAKKLPQPRTATKAEIELRPIFELEDFGRGAHPRAARAGRAPARPDRRIPPARLLERPRAGPSRPGTRLGDSMKGARKPEKSWDQMVRPSSISLSLWRERARLLRSRSVAR